jgi:hypothetical protein
MDSKKTGLILGGLVLTAGAGVGIYFLAKKYKEAGTAGLGAFRNRLYHGDWNAQNMNAWRRQQGRLYTQRQGIPQNF